MLNRLFRKFDGLAQTHGVQKARTRTIFALPLLSTHSLSDPGADARRAEGAHAHITCVCRCIHITCNACVGAYVQKVRTLTIHVMRVWVHTHTLYAHKRCAYIIPRTARRRRTACTRRACTQMHGCARACLHARIGCIQCVRASLHACTHARMHPCIHVHTWESHAETVSRRPITSAHGG